MHFGTCWATKDPSDAAFNLGNEGWIRWLREKKSSNWYAYIALNVTLSAYKCSPWIGTQHRTDWKPFLLEFTWDYLNVKIHIFETCFAKGEIDFFVPFHTSFFYTDAASKLPPLLSPNNKSALVNKMSSECIFFSTQLCLIFNPHR